jgi:hypothetical protein
VSHQENNVWNNYSWTPKPVETETEPLLPVQNVNTPPIPGLVFENELDDYDWYDDFYEETGIAD